MIYKPSILGGLPPPIFGSTPISKVIFCLVPRGKRERVELPATIALWFGGPQGGTAGA